MKFRKGDRVEITAKNGEILHGTVIRGGKTVTAVIDGRATRVKGPASAFRTSDRPVPAPPPSAMDKWAVKSYREIPGHGDTPTFHARITLEGEAVAEAMNDGHGGANDYHFRDNELRRRFLDDCREWAEKFAPEGMNLNEPDSMWLDWYVFERPYGKSPEAFLREFKEQMDELLS